MGRPAFDADETETWRILFEQQMGALPGRCRPEFLEAVDFLGYRADVVPDLPDIEQRLAGRTGWSFVPVQGGLQGLSFHDLIASRRFPVSSAMRPRAELAHAKVPDYFHDVFGHVPLLSHDEYSRYLQRLGELACEHRDDPAALTRVNRAISWAIEFGLMGTHDDPRVFGAAVLSSLEELDYVFSGVPEVLPFTMDGVTSVSHVPASLQERYFAVGSFSDLVDQLEDLEALLTS
jgi:phenylalanine-4-hydroxylase